MEISKSVTAPAILIFGGIVVMAFSPGLGVLMFFFGLILLFVRLIAGKSEKKSKVNGTVTIEDDTS